MMNVEVNAKLRFFFILNSRRASGIRIEYPWLAMDISTELVLRESHKNLSSIFLGNSTLSSRESLAMNELYEWMNGHAEEWAQSTEQNHRKWQVMAWYVNADNQATDTCAMQEINNEIIINRDEVRKCHCIPHLRSIGILSSTNNYMACKPSCTIPYGTEQHKKGD